MKLIETQILKSRSGIYKDTSENRRKHRVGQKYGAEKQPEDGEKTEEKETDPAKELEAVNKVIAAINEGKLNLPAAEVMKLSEKKQKLEAAKKQAEKINAGVKANEEKRNAKEIKETNKKINEASKQKKYDDRLRAVENEIKKRAESKNEPEKNEKSETEKEADEETYTRAEFDDLPNSGKVNLKKYLSDKVKKTADQNLGVLSKVSTDNLKKMEAGLVSEFNSQFDDLPKSRRAEKLYSIMKVKNELAKRGTEAK
jgi:hypothetical protein